MHIYDATAAVKMVWQRLEDSYGSSEAIENSLLKKLEDFPKIANKITDWGTELDAACVGGFLPGLSYLDTSRGITPIVQKLTRHLQFPSFASLFSGGPSVPKPERLTKPNFKTTGWTKTELTSTSDGSHDLPDKKVVDPDKKNAPFTTNHSPCIL